MNHDLELEYWKAGLTLLGIFITASIPAYLGYRQAKRLGLTNASIEEIKDRASFREAQRKMVESVVKQTQECHDQVSKLMKERQELMDLNVRLLSRVTVLEVIVERLDGDHKQLRKKFDDV